MNNDGTYVIVYRLASLRLCKKLIYKHIRQVINISIIVRLVDANHGKLERVLNEMM
jgi:hypothetical protein